MKAKAKVRMHPPWHPEFRIAEDLPDIKVIRTDFLVNIAVFSLAGILLLILVYREVAVASARGDLEELERQVADMQEEDLRLGQLMGAFNRQRPVFDDLRRFFDMPVNLTRFMVDMAEIRPEQIALDQFEYTETPRVVGKNTRRLHRFTFIGQTRDLALIENFTAGLTALEYLQDFSLVVTQGPTPRNPELGTFGFSMQIEFLMDNLTDHEG